MRLTSQKGFSGLDERIELQNGIGSATEMLNFRVTDAGSLTKRSNVKTVWAFASGEIYGVWSGTFNGKDSVYVISGSVLYYINPKEIDPIPQFVSMMPSREEYSIFEFNGFLYLKSASNYLKYNGEKLVEVEGYIPCIATNCTPEGEGEVFEQINLICKKRRQLFSGDGTSIKYNLAEQNVESIISIKLDGEDYPARYSLVDSKELHFEKIPTVGINNLEVVYQISDSASNRDRIMKCTKLMLFGGNSDGRAFLWGNPDFPNYRFHSELAEGIPSVEYFPVNAFTVIGNSKINCIIQQYDRQLIFTKNEAYYSYCELRDDGLGNIFSSFPVYSLNGSKGCLVETRGCIIDNRPVTICDDGLNMWEATSVEDEKNAICFSAPITKTFTKLIMGDKTKLDIFDFQSNRELYLLADKIAFVYNYGNGTWYTFNDLAGKYHTAFDSTVYFADDIFLYSYSNGFDTNYQNVFRWKSAFITAGQASGSFDVVGVEADVHIAGDATLKFTLEGNDGKALIERTFKFTENEDKYLRISFRPAIKRLMPFRINIEGRGYGDYTIHGISIKTRQKERSKRIGLL